MLYIRLFCLAILFNFSALATPGDELDIPYLRVTRVPIVLEGNRLHDMEGWLREESQNSGENGLAAAFLLATLCAERQEWDQAATLYRRAETLKSAMNNFAYFYERGLGGVPRDIGQSLELLRRAEGSKETAFNIFRHQALYGTQEQARALLEIGAEALKAKGVYGKKLDLAQRCLEKAGQRGEMEAFALLGRLYDDGHDVERDGAWATYYFLKAAEGGLKRAQRRLGFLYEEQGQRDHALLWYDKVAEGGNGDPVGMFRYAYLTHKFGITGTERERAIGYLNKAGEKDHVGALLLLGKLYESGWGSLGRNLEQAKRLWRRAKELGSYAATLKLQFSQRGMQGLDFERSGALLLRSQALHEARRQVVFQELARNLTIYSFNLTQDFAATEAVLRQVEEERANERLWVNRLYLSADPYFVGDIGWERRPAVEDQSMQRFLADLKAALPRGEGYVGGRLGDGLTMGGIFDNVSRVLMDARNRDPLRRRIVNIFELWMALKPGQADVKKGNFGLLFVQNWGRCGDGISDFVSGIEWDLVRARMPLLPEGEVPLGAILSQLFLEHKVKFLSTYRPPLRDTNEEVTEAPVLLRQRMRLPLGLPGGFEPPLYPQYGRGGETRYQPAYVMGVFLRGGSVEFPGGTRQFQGYTPQLMIELLKASLRDANGVLKKQKITDFVMRDEELSRPFQEAFLMMDENDYVNPTADTQRGELEFKDALLESILVKHGYLLRREAP